MHVSRIHLCNLEKDFSFSPHFFLYLWPLIFQHCSLWFLQVQENSLATIALFAYLGRESRLFLSRHNIKDTDEQIKKFLRYTLTFILLFILSTLTYFIEIEDPMFLQLLGMRHPLHISGILNPICVSAPNGGQLSYRTFQYMATFIVNQEAQNLLFNR